MTVFIVLLRAIGPATHKIMSMAQWRDAIAADEFFRAPQTYVSTGNMIVEGLGPAEDVEQRMDAAPARLGLGQANKAVVRTSHQLRALVESDPFPQTSGTRPAEVGVHFFADAAPRLDWVADYHGPERIVISNQHLIVDYGGRGAVSSLPAIVERKSGLATARNWNMVRALAERAAART